MTPTPVALVNLGSDPSPKGAGSDPNFTGHSSGFATTFSVSKSLTPSLRATRIGSIPHMNPEPDYVTASEARQSMSSGVMDCRASLAMTAFECPKLPLKTVERELVV